METSYYETQTIFSFVMEELLEKQLKEFENIDYFSTKNYLLLSYLLNSIEKISKLTTRNNDKLKIQIVNAILKNLEQVLSNIFHNKSYIDFDFYI